MDFYRYAYTSHRNIVFGRRGMVYASVPAAAEIGLDTIRRGGNAMDAAISVAAAMPLMEPVSNGLGSDAFALVWSAKDRRLYGLNGSGPSPAAINAECVKSAGLSEVPCLGWLPVTVPGAVSAWSQLQKRFGTMSMDSLLAPAMKYARDGFPVAVNVARQWKTEAGRIGRAYDGAPELFGGWRRTFSKDGAPYEAGELFSSNDYADTLAELASTDCESFYRGALMEKILDFSNRTGGFFSREDFTSYNAEWVEPVSTDYRGYTVCEIPPNGHGITALMALNIFGGFEPGQSRETAENYHRMIESIKLAFADTRKYVADPRYMRTKVGDMLSAGYASKRRGMISEKALCPSAGDPACGGTVYFCTADGEGNMVSFIQSNYTGFGSGVVVPGTAISLQSRGANFSMDPESDNYIEGGKKPYHTIIPGFLMKDGKPVGPFGVMGGFMQPQGHLQVITNTVDFNMNPQEALDAPRFQWCGGLKVQLEREVSAHIAHELEERGHEVEIVNTNIDMGRGGMIWRLDNGTLCGGAEPRCDGTVAAI